MNNPVMSMEASPALVRTAHIVYALHAAGLALGAFGAATVIGSFLFGWPSIIAVIVNYIYRSDARGTWLESHSDWQIRTFWWSLLWGILGWLTFIILIGWAIWGVAFVWFVYRIAKGWLNLNDNRPMTV